MAEIDPMAFQRGFQTSQGMFDQRRQNKLQDLLMGQKEREIQQENALSQLYQGAIGADGTIDRTRLLTGAAQAGLGNKIPGLQTQFLQQDKAQMEQRKAKLEQGLKQVEVMGQVMSGVRDQASYDAARQQAVGILGPDAASNMPPQFDPAMIEQGRMRAMSVKEQMEQEWKRLQFGETQRHNQVTEGLSSQGQQITMRGQDMTDVRARDLNATRAEEARIKREQKDDVNNQTKASQVASFDTMLGTLDRLAQHPGLPNSVGLIGALPTRPGSASANFQAELNTFQSQAFLPMVAQLKGMGALSDAEGKKLTAAVGALDPKMGEDAFRASIKRITQTMQEARNRMVGGTGAQGSGTKRVTDKAAYDALPSGTVFTAPDGSTRRKP